jgi:hypothetical protein
LQQNDLKVINVIFPVLTGLSEKIPAVKKIKIKQNKTQLNNNFCASLQNTKLTVV